MTLKEYLEKNRIKQADFAEITGLKQAMISLYINGQRRPSPETALKIEKATGGEVKAVDLIFGRSPDAA